MALRANGGDRRALAPGRWRLGLLMLAVAVVLLALAAPAGAATFSNTGSITLNDPNSQSNGNNNATATPYPSTIAVSGLTGTISSLSLTLSNVSYPFSQDLSVLLVAPGGETFVPVADLGPNSGAPAAASNATLTISDAGTATTQLASWSTLSTIKPIACGNFNQVWESPAPTGPYGNQPPPVNSTPDCNTQTLASVFNGASPNGTWKLYVITTSGGDGTGAIAGGWTLNISTASVAATTTTLASNNNPSFTSGAGSSVTLTASVSSTSTVNEGTMAFTDGGTAIAGCGAVAVASGQATCTTTFSTEGNHSLLASYNGTANFGASHSSTLAQVVNNHTTVTGSNFCNTGSITLNNPPVTVADATPYPSNVFVSGLGAVVNHVAVTLNNVTYSHSQDIDALLVGPGGQTLILVANLGPNSGAGAAASNSTVTFSDAGVLPASGMLTPWGSSSTFKPVNYGGFNELWGSPAPGGPYGDPGTAGSAATLASQFNGTAANGTWSLYVITTAAGDGTGAIAGGWCANITANNLPATTTTLASNNNPSFTTTPGNSATLTATVSSTSTVSEGTVAFTDGGTTIPGCGAVAVSAGTATCTTTFSTEGSHALKAVYSGTVNFATSNATLSQQVDNHTTVTGGSYCNTGSITLNNPPSTVADASPYPSRIFISGKPGNLTNLTVTLKNTTYSHSEDIDALLVGPSGQTLILVANLGPNSGAGAPASNSTVTFSDAGLLPPSGQATPWGSSSTFKPVNYGGFNEVWGAPAPAGPYGNPGTTGTGATLNGTFAGTLPNGTWSLYAITTAGGDGTGAIAGGWCLGTTIQKAPLTIGTLVSGTPVTVGTPTSDTATLSGVPSGADAPTGSVTFKAYGPSDPTCSNAPAFTSTTSLTGAGTTTPSGTFMPTSVGTYLWTASYGGDLNYQSAATACGDAGESVVVTKASPAIATTASASIALGASISDSAVLSGGASPTGTITFNVYGPNDATCSNVAAFTSTATVSGNGTYGSGNFTPTAPGTYRFVASYGGDANNTVVAGACGDAGESVVVSKAAPALVTNASASVAAGGGVTDTATLSGGVVPTGTITFSLFGPSNSTCTGTPIFTSTKTVTSGNGNYISDAFTTAAAGTYNWTASYGGDANNAAVTSVCGAANESVVVTKAAPTVLTTASAPVSAGGMISDTATLSSGVTPTGTLTFTLFGPNNATCSGAPIFTSTVSVNSGNGSYPSAAFTTSAVGTYRFIAAYSGDANNSAASTACNDANESVVVSQATPAISTTASAPVAVGGSISDSASLTAGANPTGTITFNLYGPNDATCSNAAAFTGTATVSGNGTYGSGNFTPTAPGTYRFVASYGGDANNAGAAGTCGDAGESVVVSKTAPSMATTASSAVTVGGTISDSAVLSGGVSPTGTITFNAYGPNDATCANAPAFTGTATVTGNGTYSSANFTTTQAGTYRFVASYGGDANNGVVAGACGDAGESVVVSKASPAIATTASGAAAVGGTISDSAVLSGGVSPTGTITFNVYGPNDATCSNAAAFTGTATVSGNGTYGSGNFTPTAPGTYRFVASYGGDANNGVVAGACGDAGESVVVSKAAPSVATTASAAIALGATISDSAVLSGGVGATGTITFNVYGPNDATCSNAAAFTGTATVSGNGTYGSGNFTPTAPGTYRFVASYGGDANNTAVAGACGDAGESVVVSKAASAIITHASAGVALGDPVTDTATLSGAVAPTGTVVFRLYGPADPSCSSAPAFTSAPVTVAGNGPYTSPAFTPTAVGTYLWVAAYSGDANNSAVSTACGDAGESVVVGQDATTTKLASSPNPSAFGQAVTFTATVTGSSPTGTVTFKDGSATLGTGPVSATGTATFTTSSLSAGTHSITAVYGGDASHAASTSDAVQQVVGSPAPGLPTITITSPTNGAAYRFGQIVRASYSCSDGANGPGIALCEGSVLNGSPISTKPAGTHTFHVVAVSKDGKTTTATVVYTVRRPSNHFTVSHLKIGADGTVTFDLKLPGPGIVDVLETAWKNNIVAGAASVLRPAAGRFAFARKHVKVSGAGTIKVIVKPSARGRRLIAHPAYPVVIRLWISYTPTGGIQFNRGSYGLHVHP